MIERIRENINNEKWIKGLYDLGFNGAEYISNEDILSEFISSNTKNHKIFKDSFVKLLNIIDQDHPSTMTNHTYRIIAIIDNHMQNPHMDIITDFVNEIEKFPKIKKYYQSLKPLNFSSNTYKKADGEDLSLKDVLFLDMINQQSSYSKLLNYSDEVLVMLNDFIKENNFENILMEDFRYENSKGLRYRDEQLVQLSNILLSNNNYVDKFMDFVPEVLIKEIDTLPENKKRTPSSFETTEDLVIRNIFAKIIKNDLDTKYNFDPLIKKIEQKNVSLETYNGLISFQKFILEKVMKGETPEVVVNNKKTRL